MGWAGVPPDSASPHVERCTSGGPAIAASTCVSTVRTTGEGEEGDRDGQQCGQLCVNGYPWVIMADGGVSLGARVASASPGGVGAPI